MSFSLVFLSLQCSLAHVALLSFIVKSLSFSEAQAGKSSCDRVVAQVKRKLANYIDARNDVDSLEKMYDGIVDSRLDGVSVFLAEVARPDGDDEETNSKIVGINDLNHFEYDRDSVHAWRHYKIGEGKKYSRLDEPRETKLALKGKRGGGFLPINTGVFWTATKKGRAEEPNDVDMDDDSPVASEGEDNEDLFFCSTCGSSFIQYYNFDHHVTFGKHKLRPETITMTDYAFGLYKNTLEDMVVPQPLRESHDLLQSITIDENEALEEGWALKKRKSSKRLS